MKLLNPLRLIVVAAEPTFAAASPLIGPLVLVLALALLATNAAIAAPVAYVVNAVGVPGAVSVVDVTMNSVVGTISLPTTPREAIAARDGRSVYVLAAAGPGLSDAIFVISTRDNSITKMITLGASGCGIALSPDGSKLYAVCPGPGSIVATDTGEVIATLPPLFNPLAVVVSGDDNSIYASRRVESGGGLFRLDLTNSTVSQMNDAGNALVTGFATSPDDQRLFALLSGPYDPQANRVSIGVIDPRSGRWIATWLINLDEQGAQGLAISSDGRLLYIPVGPGIEVVDTTTGSLVPPVYAGSRLANVATTPNGRYVLATQGLSGLVRYDVSTGNASTLYAFAQPYMTSASIAVPPVDAIEYYNGSLDHYFVTSNTEEIAALDVGTLIEGWRRTGMSFPVFSAPVTGSSPVCRFYIPPAYGDSHFYSASPVECAGVASKFPQLVLEASDVFYADVPDTVTGACPFGDMPVYRVWNGRTDSNHRYTPSLALRDSMVARGYVAEGYGPQQVALCVPAF